MVAEWDRGELGEHVALFHPCQAVGVEAQPRALEGGVVFCLRGQLKPGEAALRAGFGDVEVAVQACRIDQRRQRRVLFLGALRAHGGLGEVGIVDPDLAAVGDDQLLIGLDVLPSEPARRRQRDARSEEHTSELQSLMRISYAVFCLKKIKTTNTCKVTKNT